MWSPVSGTGPGSTSPSRHCRSRAGTTGERNLSAGADGAGARQRYLRQLAEISGRVGAFYVTVDIDVLDASCVPGTGTPVAGGIGSGELLGLLEGLPEPVLAYDIVEFAPSHDVGGMTGHAVMAITTAFLARIAAARD